VIPYLKDHGVPDEDAASIVSTSPDPADKLDVAVIHLPHISNFDDFDPLRYEPGVHLRFVDDLRRLGAPRVICLPGTKNTLEDLVWLMESGLGEVIRILAADGVSVVGLCGGFQMLGSRVEDRLKMESDLTRLPGLGLLPIRTCLGEHKTVTRSKAHILTENGFFKSLTDEIVEGYEIHLGQSESQAPLLEIFSREGQPACALDGACSADGRIWGCHLHGIFENDNLRRAWLESLGVFPEAGSFAQFRRKAYDHLADVLENTLDIPLLDRIIEAGA
jgi:adenosylcobyric acid synthase